MVRKNWFVGTVVRKFWFVKVKNFTFVLFNASYSNRKIGSEWLTIRAYDWDSSRVSVRSIAVP